MDGAKEAIIFMGASIIDLLSYAKRFPNAGETFAGHHFQKGSGGKGANQAVAFASISGQKPIMLTKIGDDDFGKELLANYIERGVEASHVMVTPEAPSSVSSIWVSDNGDNAIMYIPGAADCLTSEDIKGKEKLFERARLFVSTQECRPETLHQALVLAKRYQVQTMLNAAPIFPGQFREEILTLCDILCVNETEAGALTQTTVKTVDDAKAAIKALQARGAKMVIITLGENGAVFGSSEDKSPIMHVETNKTKVVDTTGAGDAFMGAMAFYLVRYPEQLSFEEKIRRSCRYASLSVERKGTQTSYLPRAQLSADFF